MTTGGRPPLGQVQMTRPLSFSPANARGLCRKPVRSGIQLYLKIGPQGGLDFFLGQEIAQSELMCPPLADELVGHAAGPDFAVPLHVIGQVLLEILAIPAAADDVLLAGEEDFVKPPGVVVVAHAFGPFFARSQRGQVIAGNEQRHAVQGLVVRVELVVEEDALRLAAAGSGVAGDQVLDRLLHVRPILPEESVVRMVQRLAVRLEHATGVAVAERLFARRLRRRRNAVRLFTPPWARCWCLKSMRRISFSSSGKRWARLCS